MCRSPSIHNQPILALLPPSPHHQGFVVPIPIGGDLAKSSSSYCICHTQQGCQGVKSSTTVVVYCMTACFCQPRSAEDEEEGRLLCCCHHVDCPSGFALADPGNILLLASPHFVPTTFLILLFPHTMLLVVVLYSAEKASFFPSELGSRRGY